MDITGYDLVERETGQQCFESDFHKLSHDLRTPLNSITGFAELLLLDKKLSPESADYIRAILSGGEALTEAVTALLDRAEERAAAQALAVPAPRKSVAGAKTALRHPILKRARYWGTLRKPRGAERTGAL